MRSPVFKLIFLIVLALAAANTALTEERLRDPATHFFVEFFGDLNEELETARDEGKKGLLIFFELDDCPFCHRMKRDVLNLPEVQAYFRKNFRPISIDIEGDTELVDFQGNETTQKAFAEKQRVRATPVIAFFDLDGKRIARLTGATKDKEEFMLLGRYVAEGHYKNTSFSRFKRAQRAK